MVEDTARRVKESFENAQVQLNEEVVVATPPPPRGQATEIVRLCTVLPYQGVAGESVITDFKKCLKKFLPNEVIPQFSYKGKKLSSVQDKKSAIRRHFKTCRNGGNSKDFKIVGSGYQSTVHRKLAESLYIRDLKPSLNKQGRNSNAFKLHLFN